MSMGNGSTKCLKHLGDTIHQQMLSVYVYVIKKSSPQYQTYRTTRYPFSCDMDDVKTNTALNIKLVIFHSSGFTHNSNFITNTSSCNPISSYQITEISVHITTAQLWLGWNREEKMITEMGPCYSLLYWEVWENLHKTWIRFSLLWLPLYDILVDLSIKLMYT